MRVRWCVFLLLMGCQIQEAKVNSPPFVPVSHHHHEEALPPLEPKDESILVIPGLTPSAQAVSTPSKPVQIAAPLLPLTEINQQARGGGSGSASPGGHDHTPTPAIHEVPQPNHALSIQDITLTETGQSIRSDQPGEAALIPNFEGKTLSITIHGDFRTAPPTRLENMVFMNEADLLHQSLVGVDPPVRVLLDDVILWTPLEASPTRIVATLESRGLLELYLKGSSHTLTVEAGQLIARQRIRVGEPETKVALSPSIQTIEVITDSHNHPKDLKIQGKHFMTYYRFAHYQVNGKPVFGHQTNIVEVNDQLLWETLVHLPTDFENLPENQLLMITPFGAAFSSFAGVQ